MGEESLESFRARLLGASVSTYAVVMVLVPLKLYCRVRAGGWTNLKWDDALTVATLALANCFTWFSLIALWPLLGRHTADIMVMPDGISRMINFMVWIFVQQHIYTFGIAFSKFTILAFYWRLFSVKMRWPIYIMAMIVFGWMISICFSVIFTCDPVQASWDITIVGAKCHDLKMIYLGGSVPNVICDVLLIMIPLPYVWGLQAPISQRLLLASLFMLGIFIAVVSIIRLNIFMHIPFEENADIPFHFREIIIWSCVEINVGLACACLPSLKPALGLLGLNRLFSFADSRALTPGPSADLHGWKPYGSHTISGSSKKPRKKGATGGLFSTIAGISRIDEEDDVFQLTDKRNHGQSTAEVTVARSSQDSKESGDNKVPQIQINGDDQRNKGGWDINVQKDWNINVQNDWSALKNDEERQLR